MSSRLWMFAAVGLFVVFAVVFKLDDEALRRTRAQTGGSCPQQYLSNAQGDPIQDSCDACCDDQCSDALFYSICLYNCYDGKLAAGQTCCACCGNPGTCAGGGTTGGNGGTGDSSPPPSSASASSAPPECASDSDCGDPNSWTYICDTGAQTDASNEGRCGTVTFYFYPTCSNGRCNAPPGTTLQQIQNACAAAQPCPSSSSAASSASSLSSTSSHSSKACATNAECRVDTACTRCEVIMNQSTCANSCDQYFCKDGTCAAGIEAVSCTGSPLCANSSRSASSTSSEKNCTTDVDCGGGLVCTTGCRATTGGCTQLCRNTPAVCQDNVCVYGTGGGRDMEYRCDPSACTGSLSSSSRSGSSQNSGNSSGGSSQSNASSRSSTSSNTSTNNSSSQSFSVQSNSSGNSSSRNSSSFSRSSSLSRSSSSASSRSSTLSSVSSSRISSSSVSSRASSTSSIVVGTKCNGKECADGGSVFCAKTQQVCSPVTGLPCIECGGTLQSSSRSSIVLSSASSRSSITQSSASSDPIVLANICDGSECTTKGGDTFCGLQGLVCVTRSVDPCIACVDPSTLSSSSANNSAQSSSVRDLPPGAPCTDNLQCSTRLCKDGFCQNPLSPDALAFLGEACVSHLQCVTNLCRGNQCVACTTGADCASGLCQNGICLLGDLPDGSACSENAQCQSGLCLNNICTDPSTLPASVYLDPVTGQPLLTSPDETLPATIIELPFMSDAGTDASVYGDITKDIPSTPSTGPAALAVMLAGGAAGWLYRKRR